MKKEKIWKRRKDWMGSLSHEDQRHFISFHFFPFMPFSLLFHFGSRKRKRRTKKERRRRKNHFNHPSQLPWNPFSRLFPHSTTTSEMMKPKDCSCCFCFCFLFCFCFSWEAMWVITGGDCGPPKKHHFSTHQCTSGSWISSQAFFLTKERLQKKAHATIERRREEVEEKEERRKKKKKVHLLTDWTSWATACFLSASSRRHKREKKLSLSPQLCRNCSKLDIVAIFQKKKEKDRTKSE